MFGCDVVTCDCFDSFEVRLTTDDRQNDFIRFIVACRSGAALVEFELRFFFKFLKFCYPAPPDPLRYHPRTLFVSLTEAFEVKSG